MQSVFLQQIILDQIRSEKGKGSSLHFSHISEETKVQLETTKGLFDILEASSNIYCVNTILSVGKAEPDQIRSDQK